MTPLTDKKEKGNPDVHSQYLVNLRDGDITKTSTGRGGVSAYCSSLPESKLNLEIPEKVQKTKKKPFT